MSFSVTMRKILREIRRSVERGYQHQKICCEVSELFALWEKDHLPTWLSRIVEGELKDWRNKEGYWSSGDQTSDH